MQHRHYGRCADSRAQQNCRILAGSQSEAAARRADIHHVAFSRPVAEKGTANPVQFTLHADAEMVSRRQIGQRIAAKNGWFAWIDEQSQNNKLTRLENRKRLSVARNQDKGSHAIAFSPDMRDSHLFETGPCWSLLLICEPGIPQNGFCTRLLYEYRLERRLPTLAQCRNPKRTFQLFARVSWQI